MSTDNTLHLRVITPDDAPVSLAPSREQTLSLPLRPLSPPTRSQQLVGSRNTRILFYYFTKVLDYSKQKALNTLFQGLSHSNPESYVREDVWFSVGEWCEIWKRAVKAAGTFRVLEKAGSTCTERQSSGDMVASLVNLVLSGDQDPLDAAFDLVPESVGLYNSTKVMDITRRRPEPDGSRRILFFTSVYDGVDSLQDWGSSPWIPGFLEGLPRGLFLPDARAKTLVRPEDPKQLLEFIFGLQRELFGLEDGRQVSYDPDTGDLLIDGQVYGERVWLVPQQAEMTQVGEHYYYDGTWIPHEEFRSGTPGLIQAIRITKTIYVGEDPSKVHPKLRPSQGYAVLEEGVLCCDRRFENQSRIFATEVTYQKAKRRIKFLLRILGIIFGIGHMFRFRKVLQQLNYFRARAEELVRLAEARRVEAEEARGKLEVLNRKLQALIAEHDKLLDHFYPTREMADLIRSGQFREGERRLVVMFTDLAGSTSMLASGNQAEARRIITDHMKAMKEVALRYGGFTLNYLGDALFIAFGIDGEAAPQELCIRACLCAVEMQRKAATMGQEMYIGLAFGEKIPVHLFEGRLDIVHPEVNMAARLCNSAANKGEVIASDRIKKLLPKAPKGTWWHDMGRQELKGFEGDTRECYQLYFELS